MGGYIALMRPHQWYKNLWVYIPSIFSGTILGAFGEATVAFVVFCLASSANYIINDIMDAPRDRKNPEKRDRPLAARKVGVPMAILQCAVLLLISLTLAMLLGSRFTSIVVVFFLLTTSYSMLLKHVVILDMALVSINFVLRAVGGAYAVMVVPSPWLIGGSFLAAMLAVTGKRLGEKLTDGRSRPVLRHYSAHMLRVLVVGLALAVALMYCMYSLLANGRVLITIVPALAMVYLYTRYSLRGEPAARHHHLLFRSRLFLALLFLYIAAFALGYA